MQLYAICIALECLVTPVKAAVDGPQPFHKILDTSVYQLSNLFALGFSDLGSEALVPGFVIEGTESKPVLIRAVEPSLAASA
jgi:hypothetical protein